MFCRCDVELSSVVATVVTTKINCIQMPGLQQLTHFQIDVVYTFGCECVRVQSGARSCVYFTKA